jgi:hypothetical protein
LSGQRFTGQPSKLPAIILITQGFNDLFTIFNIRHNLPSSGPKIFPYSAIRLIND